MLLAGTLVGTAATDSRPASVVGAAGASLEVRQPAVVASSTRVLRGGARTLATGPASPPPAPAPSVPVGCEPLDPGPINEWRRALGLPPLTVSAAYVESACGWSATVAQRRKLEHGAYNEVLHMSSGQAIDPFDGWRNSPSHYTLLTTINPTGTAIGCGRVQTRYADGTVSWWSTCRLAY